VSATVTETDLLNGEFSVPANALATNRVLRLTAWGDAVFTSGGAQSVPRFRFKMGSGPTTLIDTSTVSGIGSSASRGSWRIRVEVAASGATNVQWVTFDGWVQGFGTGATGNVAFATGQGSVSVLVAGTSSNQVYYLGGNAGAIDTTAAQAALLTVVNGSSTSTDVTLKGALMEII
jgi:hypothetical protein